MSISAWRLFFRIEKVGKIAHFGNTGFTYVTPVSELHRYLLKDSHNAIANLKGHRSVGPTNVGHGGFAPGINKRYFSSVTAADVKKSDDQRGAPKKKPKTVESPKIMLISETKSISVVTLEEATKIATRKNLHLVPVDDKAQRVKTEKAVYRLITNTEFLNLEKGSGTDLKDLNIEKDEKKKEKEVKSVMMRSKIAEHDIMSKVKQMLKWVEKGHSVRVMIGQPGDKGDAESVFKFMEKNMQDTGARVLQKIAKGDQIRFHLMPPKEVKPSKKSKSKGDMSDDSDNEGKILPPA